MKRPWASGKKGLWVIPLVLVGIAVSLKVGAKRLKPPLLLTTTPTNRLYNIALSRDGSVLAATGYDGTNGGSPSPSDDCGPVYLWDAHTLLPLKSFLRRQREKPQLSGTAIGDLWMDNPGVLTALSLSNDGKLIAIRNRESWGTAVYEVSTQKRLWQTTNAKTYTGNVQFSADGRLLALGYPEFFELREKDTGKVVAHWKARNGDNHQLFSLSPDGKTVAWIGAQKTPPSVGRLVEIRRSNDGKLLRVLPTSLDTQSIAFSPDGLQIISLGIGKDKDGVLNGNIVRCHTLSGTLLWQRDLRYLFVKDVDAGYWRDAVFSPDGKTLALRSGFFGNRVLLLDASTGKTEQELRPTDTQATETATPRALTFSPDGKRLFVCGGNSVLVWDLP